MVQEGPRHAENFKALPLLLFNGERQEISIFQTKLLRGSGSGRKTVLVGKTMEK
jgi:hypothetical protein